MICLPYSYRFPTVDQRRLLRVYCFANSSTNSFERFHQCMRPLCTYMIWWNVLFRVFSYDTKFYSDLFSLFNHWIHRLFHLPMSRKFNGHSHTGICGPTISNGMNHRLIEIIQMWIEPFRLTRSVHWTFTSFWSLHLFTFWCHLQTISNHF